jgi:hypothetical protein
VFHFLLGSSNQQEWQKFIYTRLSLVVDSKLAGSSSEPQQVKWSKPPSICQENGCCLQLEERKGVRIFAG